MIDRCYNPECPEYRYYGALGIEVDTKWHDFNDFLKTEEDCYGIIFRIEKRERFNYN